MKISSQVHKKPNKNKKKLNLIYSQLENLKIKVLQFHQLDKQISVKKIMNNYHRKSNNNNNHYYKKKDQK